jgi:hypothetical protein
LVEGSLVHNIQLERQPPPFDVQKRIEELRSSLDLKHPWYHKEQETNIKAAIKLHEKGKINGVKHSLPT